LNIQIGGAGSKPYFDLDDRGGSAAVTVPDIRRLEVAGPTEIYRLEHKATDTRAVLRTAALVIE